jgi:hypothetical protein
LASIRIHACLPPHILGLASKVTKTLLIVFPLQYDAGVYDTETSNTMLLVARLFVSSPLIDRYQKKINSLVFWVGGCVEVLVRFPLKNFEYLYSTDGLSI